MHLVEPAAAPALATIVWTGLCLAPLALAIRGLRVVPIVANAGAALLPMVVGMVTNVAAVLFKPRELMRVIRTKPWVLLVVAAIGLGGWWLWGWMMAPPAPAAGAATAQAAGTTTDWTKVALRVIEQQALPPRPTVAAPVQAAAPAAAMQPTAVSPVAAASDQPVIFRGDNARRGYGGGPSPRKLQLSQIYSADFEWFTSSPLVRGNRVYTASCYLDGQTSNGFVYCIDADTGQLIWRTHEYTIDGKKWTMKGFFSSPALSPDGKRLVIGQGLHPDGNIHLLCLDTETGEVLWGTYTELHVESSPAISGDLVVVGCGAIEDPTTHKPLPGANPGYVLAVSLATGKTLWTHPVNDPESSPVIADGMVFIGSGFNGKAIVGLLTDSDEALKAAGKQRQVWKVDTPHPATGAITVVDGLVLGGCGNGDVVYAAPDPEGLVIAIEAKTGAVRWRTDQKPGGAPVPKPERVIQDAVLGAIAVRDGIAVCPVRNGELVALRIADGSLVWRQQDPATRIHKRGTMVAGVSFTPELIYAVTANGYLGVVDPKDGKVLERHFINDKAKPGERSMTTASPWVEGGRVFVGSETGGLRVYTGQ